MQNHVCAPLGGRRALYRTLVAASLVAVAGCGGGGGGGPSGGGELPQGIWTGSTQNGFDLSTLVLENGQFFALYGTSGAVYGAVAGTFVAAGGNSFAANDARDFLLGYAPVAATVTGSFAPRMSITGQVSYPGLNQRVGFSGNYEALYDSPVNMAATVGTWRGGAYTGETITITVAAGGGFTGSSTLGCTFTGTLAPRATGKNVMDVQVTFTSNLCSLGNGTSIQGAAVQGDGQLVAVGVNAARTNGFLFIGARLS